MSQPLSLLMVEDSADDAELLLYELSAGGYATDARVVDDLPALRAALAERSWDIVISDHNLHGFDSSQALSTVREHDRDVAFVIVSGFIGEEAAVEAMKAGADDYVMKDHPARLMPAVERGLREASIRRERRAALRQVAANEARLRMLTDNMPCLIVQIQIPGDGALRITYVSGRPGIVPGLEPEALVSRPDRLFERFGADGEHLRALFIEAPETQQEIHWSGRMSDEHGHVCWFDFRGRRCSAQPGCQLWDGVFFDVTQQKQVENEVRDMNRRLRELAARANLTRETERSRIAREIHDDLGGSLTALKIDLVQLRTREPELPRLTPMIELIDDTVQAVRRICADLHPRILDDLGLQAALEWQLDRFRERSGLECRLTAPDDCIAVDRITAISVFRVFQEALTNVARHAAAKRVEVWLSGGDELVLEVRDDGRGIAPERRNDRDSFGILGMQERMYGIGGTIEIDNPPEGGTRVILRVPLQTDHMSAIQSDDERETP